MPELIANGVLPNIGEGFLQDFFRNKIKGNSNAPVGLYSFYQNDETNKPFNIQKQEVYLEDEIKDIRFFDKKIESKYYTL